MLLSHSHIDHVGGLPLFADAEIILSAVERAEPRPLYFGTARPMAWPDGLGVTPEAFGRLSYEERVAEYPRTQDIAEVAHFLEFDGLLVPSARRECLNAIVFCDRCPPSQREVLASQGVIDWTAWEKSSKGSLS